VISATATVLAIMAALHPSAPRTGAARMVADAIAYVVTAERESVFETREVDAAILVVIAWEEGRFCLICKRGDRSLHPFGSVSTFQIRATSEAQARALESNPRYAAGTALHFVRESARSCPGSPLAPYCGSCTHSIPRGIGDRRIYLAKKILGLEPAKE